MTQKSRSISKSAFRGPEKNLPADAGDAGLGWEDPLEKGLATHSSILVWRILMDRRAYSPWGNKESDTTKRLSTGHIGIIRLIFSHLKFIKSSVHSSEMEPSSHSWGESLVNHNVYHHPCHHHPCILCISILQHFI